MADTSVATINTSMHLVARSNLGPYWATENVGACLLYQGNSPPVAARTVNAGASWSTSSPGGTNRTLTMAAWFDGEGVGDSGSLIHVIWADRDDVDLKYAAFSVTAGTWSTPVTIASPDVGSTSAPNRVFITKARSGRLYVGHVRNATNSGAWESTDAGATWSSIANPWESHVNDIAMGVYCNTGDNNDCAIVFWDDDADAISIKVYDESGDSWGETAVASSMVDEESFQQWAVATRLSDGAVILTAWTQLDNAAADLKAWQLDIDLTPSVTALADVLTDTDDAWLAGLFIDQDTNDIYCAYLRGTGGPAGVAGVAYYKLSDDDGATWETEAAYQEDAADDYKWLSAGAMGISGTGGRFQPVIGNDDIPAAYVNLTNDVEMESEALVTHTMSAGVVFDVAPTWENVLPQVATNITIEVDWDNDGDFDEDFEDITEYVIDAQTSTGRDFASHLTGNASPGQLRAYLNNADGRFSPFKATSPLYGVAYPGRKVRVRDTSATPNDPIVLARDRFNRADGSLGTADSGQSWTDAPSGLVIVNGIVYSSGATDGAVLDSGEADHYVQVRLADLGTGTADGCGVFFRRDSGTDYGQFSLRSNGIATAVVVVSSSVVSQLDIEVPYVIGTLIAAYAVGGTVTFYVNGVPVGELPIADTTATDVGFEVTQVGGDSAGADDFLTLSHLETPTDGVLWTGTLENIEPDVSPGPFNTATLSAIGPLAALAEAEVTPPVYIDGAGTGHIIGSILNRAGIDLPGLIDPGQLTTGTYVRDAASALSLCRELEDVEIGFLYETQEGTIGFHSRLVRENTQTVDAVFSDDPAEPFALRYTGIRQLDWRGQVFNRIKASLSPYTEGSEETLYTDPGPYALASGETRALTATYSGLVSRWTGHSRDVRIGGAPSVVSVATETFAEGTTTAAVDMPATVAADDLLLVFSTHPLTAAGWTELPGYVYAKNAVGDEDGTSVNFTVADGPNPIVVHVFRIDDWGGSLANSWVYDSGYWVNPRVSGGGTYYNYILATFPWGGQPTLCIATVRNVVDGANPNVTGAPAGYSGLSYAELAASAGHYMYMASAYRSITGSGEQPGQFTVVNDVPVFGQIYALRGEPSSSTPVADSTPGGGSGDFTIAYDSGVGGSSQVHENIEVTGYPIVEGDLVTVVAEDVTSQGLFGIREFPTMAPLFPNSGEAEVAAARILAASKDPHPPLSISFVANKSVAYRNQAMLRRVGDRITVRAENNADLGIDEDFFIESIEHRFGQGNTYHEVLWTLSPSSVTDP